MEKSNDEISIPEYLIQTVETLLNCLSLSQQNGKYHRVLAVLPSLGYLFEFLFVRNEFSTFFIRSRKIVYS